MSSSPGEKKVTQRKRVHSDNEEEEEANNEKNEVVTTRSTSKSITGAKGAKKKKSKNNDSVVASAAAAAAAAAAGTKERVWRLSKKDTRECYCQCMDWSKKFNAFHGLPASVDPAVISVRQEQLVELVDELYQIWTMAYNPVGNGMDPLSVIFSLFFQGKTLNYITLSEVEIEGSMMGYKKNIESLAMLHRTYHFCDSANPEHNCSMSKLNNIMKAMQNGYQMLLHAYSAQLALNPSAANVYPSKNVLYFVDNFINGKQRLEEATGLKKLVLYIREIAAQKGYRRYRDGVY